MSGHIELQNLRASSDVLGHQANRISGGDFIVQMDVAMTDQNQKSAAEEEIRPVGEDSISSAEPREQAIFLNLPRIFDPRPLFVKAISMFKQEPYTFDERLSSVTYERLDDYPQGYPQLAAYLNLDPNFPVYRRFGTLRHRVMVQREVELMKLEQKLNEMDKKDWAERRHRVQSIRKDHEDALAEGKEYSEREELINEIDIRLKNYDDLLFREQKSQAMSRPTERNYASLLNYLWNEKAIVRSEIKFADLKDDFVVLSTEQDSPFHAMIENLVAKTWSNRLKRFLATPKQRRATDNHLIHLFSRPRINLIAQTLITLMVAVVFMIPVSMLTLLNISDRLKLIIMFISIIIFPVVVGSLSRPKRSELLTMTVAYVTVLVVFVANISQNPSSGRSNFSNLMGRQNLVGTGRVTLQT